MARWCLKCDHALNDDEKWNSGCTDEWGTHHSCEGCPHNKYMGEWISIRSGLKENEDGQIVGGLKL